MRMVVPDEESPFISEVPIILLALGGKEHSSAENKLRLRRDGVRICFKATNLKEFKKIILRQLNSFKRV